MGIIIISTSCALVNMLFQLTSQNLAVLARRNLLPGHPPGLLNRRVYILLFAILIGGLMMSGLAGKEHLEVFIRAALLLWPAFSGRPSVLCCRTYFARFS
jgi:hypothetical protein